MPGTEPGKSGQPVLLWVYLVLAPLTTPPPSSSQLPCAVVMLLAPFYR